MTRMKLLLAAGTALLAFAASEPAAHAQRVNFIYTGKLDTFMVPETGTYQIVAFGAQGGDGAFPGIGRGGRGAEIGGNFTLTAGDTLQIAVGGAGISTGEGGGGGGGAVSWSVPVTRRSSSPVVEAAAAVPSGAAGASAKVV